MTTANPEIVDQIRAQVQGVKKTRSDIPKHLSRKDTEEIAIFGRASE